MLKYFRTLLESAYMKWLAQAIALILILSAFQATANPLLDMLNNRPHNRDDILRQYESVTVSPPEETSEPTETSEPAEQPAADDRRSRQPGFRQIVPSAPGSELEEVGGQYIDSLALILPIDAGGLSSIAASRFHEGCLQGLRQMHSSLRVELYITDERAQSAVIAYEQATTEGADFIIGPMKKQSVQALLKAYSQAPVPTLLLQPGIGDRYYVLTMDIEQEVIELARVLYEKAYRILLVSDNSTISRRQASAFSASWARLPNAPSLSRFYVYEEAKDWQRLFNKLKRQPEEQAMPLAIFAAGNGDFIRQVRGFVPRHHPIFASSIFFNGAGESTFLDNLWIMEMPWFIRADEWQAFETPFIRTHPVLQQRFYALGVDACQAVQHSSEWFEGWHFSGVSGVLELQQNTFHRRGILAKYQSGILQVLP